MSQRMKCIEEVKQLETAGLSHAENSQEKQIKTSADSQEELGILIKAVTDLQKEFEKALIHTQFKDVLPQKKAEYVSPVSDVVI